MSETWMGGHIESSAVRNERFIVLTLRDEDGRCVVPLTRTEAAKVMSDLAHAMGLLVADREVA